MGGGEGEERKCDSQADGVVRGHLVEEGGGMSEGFGPHGGEEGEEV